MSDGQDDDDDLIEQLRRKMAKALTGFDSGLTRRLRSVVAPQPATGRETLPGARTRTVRAARRDGLPMERRRGEGTMVRLRHRRE